MVAAWALTFHDLHSDAQQVMRACAVLDQPSISLVSAAAAVDTGTSWITARLTSAANAGWGGVTDDRFDITAGARSYLRDLARAMLEQDVRLILDRLATAVTTMTDSESMTLAVREDVIGVIRAANRHGHPRLAVRVARTAWLALSSRRHPIEGSDKTSNITSDGVSDQDPATVADLGWCKRLADHGEEAAIAIRDREVCLNCGYAWGHDGSLIGVGTVSVRSSEGNEATVYVTALTEQAYNRVWHTVDTALCNTGSPASTT